MTTPNSQVPHERDFYTEAQTNYTNSDIKGRLNASTQDIAATQSLINTQGTNPANPRYKTPDSFITDVNTRYNL